MLRAGSLSVTRIVRAMAQIITAAGYASWPINYRSGRSHGPYLPDRRAGMTRRKAMPTGGTTLCFEISTARRGSTGRGAGATQGPTTEAASTVQKAPASRVSVGTTPVVG